MYQRLGDFIERTAAAGSIIEVEALLKAELAHEGFDNLVFARTKERRLDSLVWTDLPEGYAGFYMDQRWDLIDPVLHHTMDARRPFAWDRVTERARLTGGQKRFLSECRDIGVHSGMTVPFHAPNGDVDLISVSMRAPGEPPAIRLPHLYALTVQSWMRYGDFAPAPNRKPTRLSAREFECLKWVKDGKTNWEIGQIMSISEKTVEFHMTNVMRKLGADGRLTAVITALRMGLIDL